MLIIVEDKEDMIQMKKRIIMDMVMEDKE